MYSDHSHILKIITCFKSYKTMSIHEKINFKQNRLWLIHIAFMASKLFIPDIKGGKPAGSTSQFPNQNVKL